MKSIIAAVLLSLSLFATLPDTNSKKYRVVKYSPSKALISAIDIDGKLSLWSVKEDKKLLEVADDNVTASFIKFNKRETQLAIGTEQGIALLLDFKAGKLIALPQTQIPPAMHTAIEFNEILKGRTVVAFGDEKGGVVLYEQNIQTKELTPTMLHAYDQRRAGIFKAVEILQFSDDGSKLSAYLVNQRRLIGPGNENQLHPSEVYQGPTKRVGFSLNAEADRLIDELTYKKDTSLGIQKHIVFKNTPQNGWRPIFDSAFEGDVFGTTVHNFSSYAYDDNLINLAYGLQIDEAEMRANPKSGDVKLSKKPHAFSSTHVFNLKHDKRITLRGVFGNFMAVSDNGSLLAVAKIDGAGQKGDKLEVFGLNFNNIENKRVRIIEKPKPLITLSDFQSPIRSVRFARGKIIGSAGHAYLKLIVLTEDGIIHLFAYSLKDGFYPINTLETGYTLLRNTKPHYNSEFIRFNAKTERAAINYADILTRNCNKKF